MGDKLLVSLVIPLYNESQTVKGLIDSIRDQSLQPDEIILVDGGSADHTVGLLKEMVGMDPHYRIIEAGRAMPGKGRNIGAGQAKYDWIAFTDGGILLDRQWLENLVKKAADESRPAMIYGNFSPQIAGFFDRCATIAYVPALRPGKIRGKFIASSLFIKEVWGEAGGFPDWRATEDLVFMEKAGQLGYKAGFAPDAMVYWKLRPTLLSTYRKFELYSKYNVWAGRQAHWHYGVARQYAILLLAIILAVIHTWYWILLLPVWMLGRVLKRIFSHRHEFGTKTLFNPAVFFMVMLLTLTIDTATFSGWIQALVRKKNT